jgi:trehalose 6-phosphate synthase
MAVEERRARWSAMMARLKANSVHKWFADFAAALAETHGATELPAIAAPPAAPALVYRPELPAVGLS